MKRLYDDIKKLEGNVVAIGVLDEKIRSIFEKNQKLNVLTLEKCEKRKIFGKTKKMNLKDGKKVKINKYRKAFKKKSIEYVIVDLNNVYEFSKYLASNNIYICNGKIYIYGESEMVNAKIVEQKYKRYKCDVESIQDGNKFLVIVDCSEAKYNFFKEKFYFLVDSMKNLGDMISYFLTS